MENNNDKNEDYFNLKDVKPVTLTLLDDQIEIILRALEIYGYNLEFMTNSSDNKGETIDRMALLRYTYEQVLSTEAEQVNGKANNEDNLNEFGKLLLKEFAEKTEEPKLKVI